VHKDLNAARGNDFNERSGACTQSGASNTEPWWSVDLGARMSVARVQITNTHHWQIGQY